MFIRISVLLHKDFLTQNYFGGDTSPHNIDRCSPGKIAGASLYRTGGYWSSTLCNMTLGFGSCLETSGVGSRQQKIRHNRNEIKGCRDIEIGYASTKSCRCKPKSYLKRTSGYVCAETNQCGTTSTYFP